MSTMNTPPATSPIPASATQIIHLEYNMPSFDEDLMKLCHDWAPQDGKIGLGDPTVGLHQARPCI